MIVRPEFYRTMCPHCEAPLKIYPRKGTKMLDLDWSEWHEHMKEEHPSSLHSGEDSPSDSPSPSPGGELSLRSSTPSARNVALRPAV